MEGASPPGQSQTEDELDQHYETVALNLAMGIVTPVLGAGASLYGRSLAADAGPAALRALSDPGELEHEPTHASSGCGLIVHRYHGRKSRYLGARKSTPSRLDRSPRQLHQSQLPYAPRRHNLARRNPRPPHRTESNPGRPAPHNRTFSAVTGIRSSVAGQPPGPGDCSFRTVSSATAGRPRGCSPRPAARLSSPEPRVWNVAKAAAGSQRSAREMRSSRLARSTALHASRESSSGRSTRRVRPDRGGNVAAPTVSRC